MLLLDERCSDGESAMNTAIVTCCDRYGAEED